MPPFLFLKSPMKRIEAEGAIEAMEVFGESSGRCNGSGSSKQFISTHEKKKPRRNRWKPIAPEREKERKKERGVIETEDFDEGKRKEE